MLARSARRAAGLLTFLASVGLMVLAIRFAGVEGPGAMDARFDAAVQGCCSTYRAPLYQLVVLAGPAFDAVACVLLALGGLVRHKARLAVVAVAGPTLTGLATLALKPAIGRTLDGGYALPSGHTAGAAAVATVAALFVVSMAKCRRGLTALLSGAVVLVVTIGISVALVVNNLHYTTDTLAGFCTAVAAVLGTALAVDSIASRFEPSRRPSTAT